METPKAVFMKFGLPTDINDIDHPCNYLRRSLKDWACLGKMFPFPIGRPYNILTVYRASVYDRCKRFSQFYKKCCNSTVCADESVTEKGCFLSEEKPGCRAFKKAVTIKGVTFKYDGEACYCKGDLCNGELIQMSQ